MAGGGSSSSEAAQASAGLFGLAFQAFELTLDSLLAFTYATIGVHNASLDGRVGQLQTAIHDDPLFNTSEGHMAVLMGEFAAFQTLGSR